MEDVSTSFDRFRRWLCGLKSLWSLLLGLTLVHLLLVGLVWNTIEPGSSSYYVVLMDLGLIGVLLAFLVAVFSICGLFPWQESRTDARWEE